ncbi:hypothetical protein V6N13_110659 [Hibiscus sabdariffa]
MGMKLGLNESELGIQLKEEKFVKKDDKSRALEENIRVLMNETENGVVAIRKRGTESKLKFEKIIGPGSDSLSRPETIVLDKSIKLIEAAVLSCNSSCNLEF